MALGIDIYRYQTVNDWNAVERHGVSFVYVKGSDGFGPAQVRADGQVRGAQSVGLPVGLYHYAQLGDPRRQARVLAAEVHRLKAYGLPPALDLESPHVPGAAARTFTVEFLDELRRQGFQRVCLYANTSMLTGIGVPTLDDDSNLVIWAANYGPNNGSRNKYSYGGRVDIHQYTSVGTVPGISGRVDLNESLTSLIGQEDDDMGAVEQGQLQMLLNQFYLTSGTPGRQTVYDAIWEVRGLVSGLAAAVAGGDLSKDEVLTRIDNAVRESTAETVSTVVLPALEAVLAEALGEDNKAQAEAIVTALAVRLTPAVAQEGNPA